MAHHDVKQILGGVAEVIMPRQWVEFVEAHFLLIWLLSLGWVVLALTFKHYRYRSKGYFFQDPPAADILYSEGFASGRSLKSWYTRLGGASNCLKVMLTDERLFVRPIFPFSILGPDFDLVHSIPLKNVVSVVRKNGALVERMRIKFRLTDGTFREIEIISKKPNQFEANLSALIDGDFGQHGEN